MFLYTIGAQGRDVYRTFTFQTLEKDRKVEELFAAFEAHCNPKKNETVERYQFFTRNQEHGESFDKYLTELRILEKSCNFGTLKDSLLRDKIVCGIRDSHLRERLLRETDLTYKKCVAVCRAAELSKQQSKTLEVTEAVSKVSDKKGEEKKKQPTKHDECKFCGKRHAFEKGKCPAFGKPMQ